MLFDYLARRAIVAFERRWHYDASYLRDVLVNAGWQALLPLNALNKVARYRRGVPASVYHAAKIAAVLAADCGPCAQLAISIAEFEGVQMGSLRAIVAGDRAALGSEERLGYDFAQATLRHEPADEIRAAVRERWGARAVVSLAYALVAAQAYPTFKYATGYGQACVRLNVGGTETVPHVSVPA